MSGQLVGEVLTASDTLRERGLPERGFHALIAIAEKAETQSRRGSVRWDHIRAALYGASLSTAKRAIADLKTAGLIRVVKRGFDNQNGRSAAPIYEITERITQVTQSVGGRMAHSGDPIATDRTGQIGDRTGQIGDRTGHPGDLLDGPIDGSIDGSACARDASPTLDPGQFRNDPPEDQSTIEAARPAAADAAAPDLLPPIHWPEEYPEPEPPARCPKHADQTGWIDDPCPPCGTADKAHKAWEARRVQWRTDRAAAFQAWIAACDQCDEAGWLMDDPEDKLPAVKCQHAPNVIVWSALHPDWRQHGPAATQQRRAS